MKDVYITKEIVTINSLNEKTFEANVYNSLEALKLAINQCYNLNKQPTKNNLDEIEALNRFYWHKGESDEIIIQLIGIECKSLITEEFVGNSLNK